MRAHLAALALFLTATCLAGAAEGGSSPADKLSSAPSGPHAGGLSAADAIRIASDFAQAQSIDLGDFDAPRAARMSAARGGKWRVFFVRKSHQMDSCFSVVVYSRDRAPRLRWCS